MFNVKDRKRLPLQLLFFIGMLIGGVSFIIVYGVRILDFTNTGWLFNGDNDLRQHYIAWCHFRQEPWTFPIGLIKSLSYPNSMSVIYTDSIPLFAVLFKIYAGVMPQTFQYFGLFGLISFMLMGGLSSVLLARFVNDDVICLVGSVFYVISFTVIQRMFYHTALAAQWIIILALIVWVYDAKISGMVKKSLIWGGMGFLCVSIHSYFLPMAGMILAMLMIQQFYLAKKSGMDVKKALVLPASEFLAYCFAGLLTLYILGGFYGGANVSGPGLGTFSSNLNTFVNPLNDGKLLPELPLYFDFQYEGFGYLGAGILALYVITAIGIIFRMVRRVPEEAFHQDKIYGRLSLAVVIISFLAASLPIVTFCDKEIVHIPYPSFVEKLLGIFRSNGRLIWVAVYVLMTAAICFMAYTFRRYRFVTCTVIIFCLILQIIDISGMIKGKHEYCQYDYQIVSLWDDPELTDVLDDCDEIVFLYTDNDITLMTAYSSYLCGGKLQNNYYFARDIDDDVRANIEENMTDLREGNLRDNVIYVVTEGMYQEDTDFYGSIRANIIRRYDHLFIYK